MKLPEITTRIERETMIRISGPGNIHSDDKAGIEQGLGGMIAQGGQLHAYLIEMMFQGLGEKFASSSDISVKFVIPVRPGDSITTKSNVTKETETNGRTDYEWDIWLENQRGEKVTVGVAKATV